MKTVERNEAAAEKIAGARFDLEGLAAGETRIAGRLSVRRQFLGTRSTPMFADVIRFHSFAGEELRFLNFDDSELQQSLLEQLSYGRGIAVVIVAQIEVQRVGHDGINMSQRLKATVTSCETVTGEALAMAAMTAEEPQERANQFKKAIKPDVAIEGVTVSLDMVFARSKNSQRGSGITFSGIRVFNTLDEAATVKIKGLQIEQNGVSQAGKPSGRSAPGQWDVAANSWTDAIYVAGKSPKRTWAFEPTDPLEPEKPVSLELNMEINGEDITLKRTVMPK